MHAMTNAVSNMIQGVLDTDGSTQLVLLDRRDAAAVVRTPTTTAAA
jgi:hypothetical protein